MRHACLLMGSPPPNNIIYPSVINIPAPEWKRHCVALSVVDTEVPLSAVKGWSAYF